MEASHVEAFFDDLVLKLHREGVFKTYDKPKGRPRPASAAKPDEWQDGDKEPVPLKSPHADPQGRGKNAIGTAWHIGDEPYSVLTTDDLSTGRQVRPDQLDIGIKTTSIKAAIQHYMPDEAFAQYLDHFYQQITSGKDAHMLVHSLSDVNDQTGGHRGRPSARMIAQLLDNPNTTSTHLRTELAKSRMTQELGNYPELCLTLGIYHAAHRSYLEQFDKALKRQAHVLSPDEMDNAHFTLHSNAFNQFKFFLLFATVMPLTIFHYEQEMAAQKSEAAQAPGCPFAHQDKPNTAIVAGGSKHKVGVGSIDHDRMHRSIQAAWETFFERDLLRHDYNEDGKTAGAEENATMTITCPAKRHLEASAKTNLIEKIYERVVQDKDRIQPIIDNAQEIVIENTVGRLLTSDRGV